MCLVKEKTMSRKEKNVLTKHEYLMTAADFCNMQVRTIVKPGCSKDVLKAALSAMSSVADILSVMSISSNGTA